MTFILISIHSSVWSFNPYSNQELDTLEKEFIAEINASDHIIRNPLANQYLQQLSRRLARAAHMRPPHIFIVRSPEMNAFAGPGGYIGFNTALILASDTEDELAAVLAHEMAHVQYHHLYRFLEHQQHMQLPMLGSMLASIALGLINPTLGSGAMLAAFSGAAQTSINFTRAQERESDRMGITILQNAGFHPNAMADFFRKLLASSQYYDRSNYPAILRTHPLEVERIAESENRNLRYKPQIIAPHMIDYAFFKEIVRNDSALPTKTLLEYYTHDCSKKNLMAACTYGEVLARTQAHQYDAARRLLAPLLQQYPHKVPLAIAMASIDAETQHNQHAVQRLQTHYQAHTKNATMILSYAQSLMAAGHYREASKILLQGFRTQKKNITLCETLARAEAGAGDKDYAYLTLAQCALLQQKIPEARQYIENVKRMAKNNPYLQARASALQQEIPSDSMLRKNHTKSTLLR